MQSEERAEIKEFSLTGKIKKKEVSVQKENNASKICRKKQVDKKMLDTKSEQK